MKPPVVFLAGAGQEPADWEHQAERLDGYSSLVLTTGELAGSRFQFGPAVEELHARSLETDAEAVVLIGLSVGAMIAT